MAQSPPPPISADVIQIVKRMQESMPSDLANAHYTINILKSIAAELSSVEEGIKEWFAGQFVATAEGENLKRWEGLAGISVDPEGYSLKDRRSRISAHLLGRFNYVGATLLNEVSRLAYGSVPTLEITPNTGTAILTFPIGLTAFEISRIVAYCQNSGPAHYNWEVNSATASSNFIVNESIVDEDPI